MSDDEKANTFSLFHFLPSQKLIFERESCKKTRVPNRNSFNTRTTGLHTNTRTSRTNIIKNCTTTTSRPIADDAHAPSKFLIQTANDSFQNNQQPRLTRSTSPSRFRHHTTKQKRLKYIGRIGKHCRKDHQVFFTVCTRRHATTHRRDSHENQLEFLFGAPRLTHSEFCAS